MELGITDGEFLKRSSIPEADWVLLSSALAGLVFSAVDDNGPAAASWQLLLSDKTCMLNNLANL